MLFSASSSLYFTKTASRSLQENPGSIPCIYVLNKDTCFMSICSASEEQDISWNIQTHNIRPSKYEGSCINAMSIPLTTAVLERIVESVILCCRFVRINKMVRTISPMSPSSNCLSSDLALRENVTWPTLMNGRHFILSKDAADRKSVLSTRQTPSLCSSLCSYTLHWLVLSPSLNQPKKMLKQAFHVLWRARKPGHHSLVGGKNLQPTALPCLHYSYIAPQSIPGFLVPAYHDGSPLGSISTDSLGMNLSTGNAPTSPPIAHWMFIKFFLETWTSR